MVHEEEEEVLVDTAGVDDDVEEEEEDDGNGDGDDDDEEEEEPVAVSTVKHQEKAVDEERHDDEESFMDAEDPTENNENADEDDETQATEEDAASHSSLKTPKAKTGMREGKKRTATESSVGGSVGDSSTKKRAPSVKGLTIPFRTVKKAMKLDPDIPIVQNEAAIMTTMAAELFLKSLAKQSHRNAKNRGRNTIRYEDVAEARTNTASLAFLETLLP
jgi:histone H3/H4